MEWLLCKLLSKMAGSLIRIEVRGRDGFLAHYVANKIEWRIGDAGKAYYVVSYVEPSGVVEGDIALSQQALEDGTNRLLKAPSR